LLIRQEKVMRTLIDVAVALMAAAVLLAAAADAAARESRAPGEEVLRLAQDGQQNKERARKREIILGSELMTSQEREEYRQRMAAAGSDAERAKVRAEHVKQMKERARLRGLQLVDPNEVRRGAK
jgi:hypothetical protein